MRSILLADDDAAFTAVLKMTLESEGYDVRVVGDGAEVFAALEGVSLLICDVNMPEVDGFTVCRRLRDDGEHLPIILLTTRDSDIDEALGLELGADDYLFKPFHRRVLLARVRALLRRASLTSADAPGAFLEAGELCVDLDRLEVHYRGVLVGLTVTEFRLLAGVMRQPGVVWSRSRLLLLMREDADSFVHERMVDAYIRRLRRKLGEVYPEFCALETVIGAGYRWRDDGL